MVRYASEAHPTGMRLIEQIEKLYTSAGSVSPEYILEHYYNKDAARSVCNKNIVDGDVVFSCHTCSDDSSVVYCSDCFMASCHDGHHWNCKNNTYGQCDCGDTVAVLLENCCPYHRGMSGVFFENTSHEQIKQLLWLSYHMLENSQKNQYLDARLRNHQGIIRLMSIVALLDDEELALDDFISMLRAGTYCDYFYYDTGAYTRLPQSFFAKLLQQQKTSQEQVFGAMLPSDYFFRVYSLRQVGWFSQEIYTTGNLAVEELMIQSINEPLGLYLAKNWGTLDYILDASYTNLSTILYKYTCYKEAPQLNYTNGFQGYSFNKTMTAIHTVMYGTERYMINNMKKQLAISACFAHNIYEPQVPNFREFLMGMNIQQSLLSMDCLYCNEFCNYINLRYVDQYNRDLVNLLCRAHIKKYRIPERLLITNSHAGDAYIEISIHKRNLVRLYCSMMQQAHYTELIVLFANGGAPTERYTSVLEIVPLMMPQVYLCRFIQEFQQPDFIKELAQAVSEAYHIKLTSSQFVMVILFDIVVNRKVFNYMQTYELVTKRYCYEYDVILSMSKALSEHLIYDYYYVISQLLPHIDASQYFEYLQSVFGSAKKSFVKFLGELFFLPTDISKNEQLKYFLASLYGHHKFSEMLQTELEIYVESYTLINHYIDLHDIKYDSPLCDFRISLRRPEYTEISYLWNADEYLLSNKMPARCTDTLLLNSNLRSFVHQPGLKAFVVDYLQQIRDNSLTNNVQMIRILRYIKFDLTQLQCFRELMQCTKLRELVGVEDRGLYESRTMSLRKLIYFRFQNGSKHTTNCELMQYVDDTETKNDYEEDISCYICHQQLTMYSEVVVPCRSSVFMNYDHIIYSVFDQIVLVKTCTHFYHKKCLKTLTMGQCSICKTCFSQVGAYSIGMDRKIYDLSYELSQDEQLWIDSYFDDNTTNPDLKQLNLMFKHLELVFSVEGINLHSDEVIYYIRSFVIIYKLAVYATRRSLSRKNYNKYSKLVMARPFYSLVLSHIASGHEDVTALIQSMDIRSREHNVAKKMLFSEQLFRFRSSLDIFRFLLQRPPQCCACNTYIDIYHQNSTTLVCLRCGQFMHVVCCVQVDGRALCPHCEAGIGMFCIEQNCVLLSSTSIYPAPYVTRFGEHVGTIYDIELVLNQLDVEHLQLLILLQYYHTKANYSKIQFFLGKIPAGELYIKELEVLIKEDRISQDDIFDVIEQYEEGFDEHA